MSEIVVQNTAAQEGAPLPPMNDDEVLAYTRGIRVKVVQTITSNPESKGMPVDNGQANLLVNMLNGLDSQAINNKRIAADQKNTDNMAATVAELLRTVNRNTAFTVEQVPGQVVDVEARVLPPTIPDVVAMPGEMDVAPPQLDYTSFVRSQGKDVDTIGMGKPHPEAGEEEDDGTP